MKTEKWYIQLVLGSLVSLGKASIELLCLHVLGTMNSEDRGYKKLIRYVDHLLKDGLIDEVVDPEGKIEFEISPQGNLYLYLEKVKE